MLTKLKLNSRKLRWAVIVGGLVTILKGMYPDLVIPEDFTGAVVTLITTFTFWFTRETDAGKANMETKE